MPKKSRRLFSTNKYERKILGIVFLASTFPVLILTAIFYSILYDLAQNHLLSNFARQYIGQFFNLTMVLLCFYFLFVFLIAYYFTHKLFGVFPRLIRELDRRISGETKVRISVRKGDYLKEFVDRVNLLIEKLP